MQFYEKNLQALIQKNPVLAAKLHAIETNEKFDVFVDEKDPLNINIYDAQNGEYFFEQKPLDAVTQSYDEKFNKFIRYPFLFMYGVENGLLLKMFLNLDKTIIVFEPELELLYIALNLFDFSQAIAEGRVKFFYTKDITFTTLNDLLSDKDLKTFLKTFELIVPNEYYFRHHSEEMIALNKKIVEHIEYLITAEGNDATDSLIGLNHHLKHMPKMFNSYKLQDIIKEKNSQTAVIVSTGPSLHKQLKLLKDYAPYVTILCIDASLPILQKEGIAPDFVFSLERVEATAKFYENLDRELLRETIIMPTSIVHPKLLQNIEGMRQAVSMRPFGYTMMFKQKPWGYVGIGMSAANMAFEFAYMSEFENIVLIGQDLAFGDDGTTHSKGAVYGENEKQYEKNTLLIDGYYGKKVKTSQTWDLFLKFFQRDIPKVLEDGYRVFNCTEGGAYIDGAEHIPFREFLEQNVTKSSLKKRLEFEIISKESQEHRRRRVALLLRLYIERLKDIQKKVEAVFLEIMATIEYLEKLKDEKRLEELDSDRLAAVITKVDGIKDIYEEDKVLAKFGNITNPYILNAELELACIMVRESEEKEHKQAKMIDWVYEHKSWLFFLAGALESIVTTLQSNYEEHYEVL